MINQPFIRASKIQNFTPMLSGDEVMKKMLRNPSENLINSTKRQLASSNSNIQQIIEESDDIMSEVLTSAFHSLTTNVMTTKEIIEQIYQNIYTISEERLKGNTDRNKQLYRERVIKEIAKNFVIVHENYQINIPGDFERNQNGTTIMIAETPFCIKKELNAQEFTYSSIITDSKNRKQTITESFFGFNNKFGLLGYEVAKKKVNNKTVTELSLVKELAPSSSGPPEQRDTIFTIRDIIESKLEEVAEIENGTAKKNTNGKKIKQNEDGTLDLSSFLNHVKDDKLQVSKNNTSLSYIMLNSPFIRTGTKNSLEVANFLNNINTIELSKCYPYLDVKFLLPEYVTTKSQKIYKTASVTQFLQGTAVSDNLTTSTYKILEAAFVKETVGTNENVIRKPAVETNMSAFTMPQTAVNFDETRVGHLENNLTPNVNRSVNDLFLRNNAVHDYTKPFMTIKSFNVDIAPTAGLMSFKTGRLSLILHDKSRMADIAPFIKPDLFGSFGAEIAIQYGWSHMDSINMGKKNLSKVDFNTNTNYFAEFLESNKVYEKYIKLHL